MKVPSDVKSYFSKMGKKGGSKTSERKTEANRRNILLRWEKYRQEHGENCKRRHNRRTSTRE